MRPRRDNDCAESALGNKRRQVDLDIVHVIVSKHPWAVARIAKEADGFSERGLQVGRIRSSDMIDDVGLDALRRAAVYEEGELEPECRLGVG
jgi:hypothetical protein